MKAAAFSYARAKCIDDALELLALHGDGAKLLSGGQSLMPAMNLRLISPELVVDIGAIEELQTIVVDQNVLRIGALIRHVDLCRSAEIAQYAPLLSEAATYIAHPAIRNRGTLGGSLAHADPAAELPACMLALDATFVVQSKRGRRRIQALDFFQGIFQTALSEDELLVGVELPILPKQSTHFFHEFSRRHGDYAIAGLAAHACIEDGVFRQLRLAYFAVGDRPMLASVATRLIDVNVTGSLLSQAADALGDALNPQEDQQASSAMRIHLAKVLLCRCVAMLLDQPNLSGAAG
jgi:aerobic carbon-monoxide dehydrogenase medium subunit